jgi:hypothetical protein
VSGVGREEVGHPSSAMLQSRFVLDMFDSEKTRECKRTNPSAKKGNKSVYRANKEGTKKKEKSSIGLH